MKFNNKFLKSGIAYTVGNFALKGINIITIPIFTAMLTTEEYGQLTYYNSWLAILTIIIGLNLYSSVRNAYVEYKDKLDEYYSTITILSVIIFCIFLLLTNIVLVFLKVDLRAYFVCNLLLIQSFGAFVINIINNKFIFEFQHKKFLKLAFSTTIIGILISIIFIKFIFTNEGYLGRVVGAAIPVVIAGLIIVITLIKNGQNKFNRDICRFALVICIPLLPHVLSNFILAQSDRIMINYYYGDADTAIYGFIYNISMILTIFWTSLDSVWVPWYTNKMAEKEYKEINAISNYYIILFTFITMCLLFVSPEVAKILTRNKDLWAGIDIVPPIVISGYFMFLYSLPVNVEYFYKKTGYISIGTFIAAIINIGLNLILLPRYGYGAAAYTTLISYIFLFIFHWFSMKKMCKEKLFNLKYILISIVVVTIASMIFAILRDYMIIRWLITIILFATVVILAIKNKGKLMNIKKRK